MQKKRLLSLVLACFLALGLAACGGTPAAPAEDTADTPADKPVLLAVSFGSSYNDTREKTIGAIEKALQEAYPDYEVRRAFTSQTILDILAERDGLEIDNVTQAMARLVTDGVKEVIVQPTHVMNGYEYDDLVEEVSHYADQFTRLQIGKPLLSQDADYDALIQALTQDHADAGDDTALVFMGHGTEHPANSTYTTLQEKLTQAGYDNYFIGTVEAEPSLEDVLAKVQASGAKKVILQPLMIVAGDHANNDMAGDEEDSWKTAFTNAGFEVTCVLKGLGELPGVQQLFCDHAKAAMEAPDPLTADQIRDGSYEIDVLSSSSMFRVVRCQLTVSQGTMEAVMTMSGDGYGRLFPGTGEEAAAASEDAFLPAVPDDQGAVTFRFPVEALNTDTPCAAWSIKKERWYDRTLVFSSEKIPAEAITAAA